MKIAIVGSRNFTDYELLSKTILNYLSENELTATLVVSGGAKGADTLGEQFALENHLETKIFYPDWKQFGRGACSKRNTQIVEFSDIVFAFWDGKSPGTKDSIDKAEKLGKKVVIVHF